MNKWPKKIPEFTEEQKFIKDDFMNDHLHAMQNKWYGFVEKFNHNYPLRSVNDNIKTLEIGAGIGAHLQYEDISTQEYYANELRPDLCRQLHTKYPEVTVVSGDCSEGLAYESHFFDRVIAIHVLEHIPDLPKALCEIHRLIKSDGVFSVVIPCEGGLATEIARRISTKPHFEKKYPGHKYSWFISTEHINLPNEIIEELTEYFTIIHQRYYPFSFIPSVEINLIIGLTLYPKK